MTRTLPPIDPGAALEAVEDTVVRAPEPTPAAGGSLFEALLRELPQPAMLQDLDGRVVAVSDAMCELTGYPADRLVGHDPEFLAPEDRRLALHTQRERLRQRVKRGEQGFEVLAERELQRRDGSTTLVRARSRIFRHGGDAWVLSTVENVGEVRAREQAMFDTAELFRLLFEDSPVPTAVQDSSFRLLRVNRAYERFVGRPREDLIGLDPMALHPPQVRELIERQRDQVMSGGQLLPEGPARIILRADGSLAPYRLHAQATLTSDGRRYVVAVLIDLTDEAQAMRQAQAEQERFRRLFERAPVGLVLRDGEQRVVQVNQAFLELVGTTPQALIGRRHPLGEPRSGEDEASIARALEFVREHPERTSRVRAAYRRADGSEGWADKLTVRVDTEDEPTTFLTVVVDCTAERQLHAELRAALRQQTALLRSMSSGVAMVVDERIVRVNSPLEGLLGIAESRLVGQPAHALMGLPERWRAFMDAARPALEAGRTHREELELRSGGGQRRVCDAKIARVDPTNAVRGFVVTLHDITELKRREADLQAANARMTALIENRAVAIAALEGLRITRCNRVLATLLGAEPADVVGRRLPDLLDGYEGSLAGLGRLGGKGSHTLLARMRRQRDGALVPCLLHVGLVDPDQAAIEGEAAAIMIAVDLTEQRAAELAMAQTERRFTRFAALLDEAIFVADRDWRALRFASERVVDVLGCDPPREGGSPDALFEHLAGDGARILRERIVDVGGRGRADCDLLVDHPTRGRRELRLRLYRADEASREVYGIAEDVTEMRVLERRRLAEAFEQRDLLVREVHHRIKNNLQGVAGLLQQFAAQRPELRDTLQEVATRIQAIAQVHGLQLRDSTELPLQRICAGVLENLGRSLGTPVEFRLETPDGLGEVRIPEQEAVPVALVVNELGANAIRHGPGGARVEACLRVEPGAATLELRNAGALPEGFDFARLPPSPSGLGLVKALLPRRGAEVGFASEASGVVVRLRLTPPAIRAAG